MSGGFSFSLGRSLPVEKLTVASSASSSPASGEVLELRNDIERLLMITEALWSFLQKEHGYTEDDLIKRIAEIDLRDGKLDGRVAQGEGSVHACEVCGRAVGRRRPTCLYCGAAIVNRPFDR